jgi:hypothetical protein
MYLSKYCTAVHIWDLFSSFLFFFLLVFLFIRFIPLSKNLCSNKVNVFYSSPNIFSGDEIKENEVSEACDTYGEEEKWTHIFGRGT